MSSWLISPSTMATGIINSHPSPISWLPSPCKRTALIPTSSRTRRGWLPCKASITEFDLYELLGIESSSGHPEIKKAYRSLQKRCHPDIAGEVGHDMAIILNEAYALLSDPISRSAYDKEQAKMVDMRGYTGKTVYSAWFGEESEQRAVFVDEVKCVGCLKCALLASKTFAIESVYGRARVVAQWADPDLHIQEAIDACPVNCISMVERSDLPALEFIMSKLPRGSVRIGSVGDAVTDVFTEADRFLRKNRDALSGHSTPTASDLQRDRRMSAVQTILSMSGWLFQARPAGEALIHIGLRSPSQPQIDKLKMAAAARRLPSHAKAKPCQLDGGEYWVPSSTPVLPPPQGAPAKATSTSTSTSTKRSYRNPKQSIRDDEETRYHRQWPFVSGIPAVASAIGAIAVGLQGGGGGELTDHVGGPLALDIVNSQWLQVVLAGATWYIAGFAILRTIEALGKNTH